MILSSQKHVQYTVLGFVCVPSTSVDCCLRACMLYFLEWKKKNKKKKTWHSACVRARVRGCARSGVSAPAMNVCLCECVVGGQIIHFFCLLSHALHCIACIALHCIAWLVGCAPVVNGCFVDYIHTYIHILLPGTALARAKRLTGSFVRVRSLIHSPPTRTLVGVAASWLPTSTRHRCKSSESTTDTCALLCYPARHTCTAYRHIH